MRTLTIDKKSLTLLLDSQQELRVEAKKELHIGWCVIEPKNIEKMLPTLNEIGVSKITFIYCERSQKSFKIDLDRLKKIILSSSQQSGRSRLLEFDIKNSLDSFIESNQNSYLVNFSPNRVNGDKNLDTVVIGCEGGLTDGEIALFSEDRVFGLDTPLVLKSESAVSAIASIILL